MIRAVLVGWSPEDWRLYRQPQWMAEVRRDPAVALHPRHHFDIEEEAFRRTLEAWDGSSFEMAGDLLRSQGAVEIHPG